MPKKNGNGTSSSPQTAAYGSETFPDLHHKMSKKVAQLTKVIYHLNTRNEDFQSELQHSQTSHAHEVEEILSDAADKINAFKAKLANAKKDSATAVALSRLKKQHKSEKEEAMNDFNTFKTNVRDREDKLRKEFGIKVEGMIKKMEDTKGKFQLRVTKFKAALERMQANKGASNAELDAMKEAHRLELDDLVKETNKKYSDMLAQRLDEEDKLELRLKEETEIRMKEMLRKHALTLATLKETMENNCRKEVEETKKISELEASKMKTHLVSKMEHLLSDLESVRRSESELKGANSSLQDHVQQLDNEVATLKEELNRTKRTLENIKTTSGKCVGFFCVEDVLVF